MEGMMQEKMDTIRKLLNLASDGGASEAEVVVALRRADELMQKYNIAEEDLRKAGAKRSDIVEINWDSPTKRLPHAVQFIASTVAAFTETRGVIAKGDKTRVRFIGRKQDAELAVYLLDLVQNTAEAEYKANRTRMEFPGMSSADKTAMKNSFQYAMGQRLRQRLNDILAQRNAGTGGTALVVSKREDIAAHMAAKYANPAAKYANPSVNKAKGPRKLYLEGVLAGVQAAEGVNITTGIGN